MLGYRLILVYMLVRRKTMTCNEASSKNCEIEHWRHLGWNEYDDHDNEDEFEDEDLLE